MNNGIIILSGIITLFVIGTLCLILDTIYNKSNDVVYVKRGTRPKKSALLDDEDLTINDDVTQSNIFQE